MSLRIIEISAPESASEKIKELSERYEAIDCWQSSRQSWLYRKEDKRMTSRILVDVKNQQDLLDALQRAVASQEDWRITLIPVEATLPRPEEATKELQKKNKFNFQNILRGSITREELQMEMKKGAQINFDFLLLVFLSSIVAGIGLIQSDVAIIIGAMVIAPLLGPNLALSFGAALGDRKLIFQAVCTNVTGLSFTLLITLIASLFISDDAILESSEMMSRTNVSLVSLILALASGGAAVLSLTAGVSSALVGVMVAVALMPPAVTLGLTLGNGQWSLAYGAGLLLAANIICVNLASLMVFRLKGIRPRTWYEEKKAKQAARLNMYIWLGLLILIGLLIWFKANISLPIQ